MYLASSTPVFLGVLAAFTSAVLFGIGDFGSGELGKKLNPFVLLSGIYIVEIPLLFFLMVSTREFGELRTNTFLFFIGVLGTIGFTCIVYGLAKGHASIVMSLAGLLALVVPAFASILIGETTSFIVWVGVAIAIVAIICVTRVSDPEHEHEILSHKKVIKISVLSGTFSGLALGTYFVGLDQVSNPIIPKLFFLQLSGFIFGVIYVATHKGALAKVKHSALFMILIGVGYQLGQVLFPFASDRTSLVVTNIIVNLYPAITIALAKFINHEKTNNVQHVGFALAILGLIFVSVGATA